MGIECENQRRAADLPRSLEKTPDDPHVTAVDAVEIPDRHRAPPRAIRKLTYVSDNLHVAARVNRR